VVAVKVQLAGTELAYRSTVSLGRGGHDSARLALGAVMSWSDVGGQPGSVFLLGYHGIEPGL
jgi:hypothetical protein